MNNNYYLFYDFETSSISAHRCQPTELAAVAIDPIRLEIIKGSLFQTLIKPNFDDEECKKLNLDPITDEVLNYTHKTREQLAAAPDVSVAFAQFAEYCSSYKTGKSMWGRPIRCGYNIFNYDDIIIDRLCSKDPYNLGYWDEKQCKSKLWHPLHAHDLMKTVFSFTEGLANIKSVSFDNMRRWMGIPDSKKSHTAAIDVLEGGEMLCRFLKLIRSTSRKVKFENSMTNFDVKEYLDA